MKVARWIESPPESLPARSVCEESDVFVEFSSLANDEQKNKVTSFFCSSLANDEQKNEVTLFC